MNYIPSRRAMLAAALATAACKSENEDTALAPAPAPPDTAPPPDPAPAPPADPAPDPDPKGGTSTKMLTGVNWAGLEFSSSKLPGRAGYDYPTPDRAELSYYRNAGANVIRLPFRWERAQPELGGGLNSAYMGYIDNAVGHCEGLGMTVVLDAHQYGRRRVGSSSYIIGQTSTVTAQHFARFWGQLARRYQSRRVVFNLINEPHDQDRGVLVRVQNEAIAAIRNAGARQLILVSGSSWSGAHSWVSSGNAAAMLGIRDSANNYAFDVHQYLDGNSSGTSGTCTSNSGNRLRSFTEWAKQHRKRGFLGEFAGGTRSPCSTELTNMLRHMRDNSGVWVGWAAWGGGSWWPDSYMFKLRPASLSNPSHRPQMNTYRQFFQR